MTKFVTVDSYFSPWDAHITKGLLESEGIPVTLATEHHVWSNWPFSHGLGGVRLQVPEPFQAAARDILDRRASGEFQEALEDQQDLPRARCHSCGSTNLRYFRSPWAIILLLATFGLSGLIFPPDIEGRKCNACGAKSRGVI